MKSDHQTRFEALLAKLADGESRPDELRELEHLLHGDSERQAQYFDWLSVHLLLEQEGAIRSEVEQTLQSVQTPTTPNASQKATPRARRGPQGSDPITKHGVRYALAAVVMLVAGGFVAQQMFRADAVSMATVVDAVGIVDGPRELTVEGSVLDVGLPLEFEAGVLSVAMPSGAGFTLEGPATLVVAGENEVRLDRGKLYATVPPRGVGFTVETPSASMVDLGTEFGVITRPGDATQSYVFLGKVRADAGEDSETLVAGQAITASADGRLGDVRSFDDDEARFTRSIDATDYLGVIESLGPHYMHRFGPSSKQRRFNSSLGEARSTVSLRGGVYASAGGPIATPNTADGFLRFVGVESTSEASVGEALEENGAYSIVLWVRVDEPGAQGVAALAGDRGPDSELGALLRITEQGFLEHRCHWADNGYVLQRSSTPLPYGIWAQVVVTGGSQRDLNLYVNGDRVAAPVRFNADLRSECDRLLLGAGSDRLLEAGLDTGPLRGALDELAVFGRCLTEKEIRTLYETSQRESQLTTY